jgi:hypothetical protein
MTFIDADLFGEGNPTNLELLNGNSPETLFEILNAAKWIEQNVVYNDGAIDIAATAVHMAIPVYYSDPYNEPQLGGSQGATAGLIDKTEPVEIHLSNIPHHMLDGKMTFGHELGHVLVDEKLGVCSAENHHEEYLCDYVGLMASIPDVEIEALDTIDAVSIMMLSERLSVSHGTVIERLMRLEKLPGRIAYDVAIPPGVKNPYFSGKISRHVVCLACIEGYEHPETIDIMTLPTFNFTDYKIYTSSRDSGSHGDTTFYDEFHKSVNLAYGRWSDQDEREYTVNIAQRDTSGAS